MSDTPETDAIIKQCPCGQPDCLAEINDVEEIVKLARKLERERDKERAKLEFLKSKGLTVGLMKTSDQPEPYLAYARTPDSEFDDTIHVNKVIDAEMERDQLAQALRDAVEILTTEFDYRPDDSEAWGEIRATLARVKV